MMNEKYDGLKVFSATKANDRDLLGEKITAWIEKNPSIKIVNTEITQSSDAEFHCLAITIFFQGKVDWNPIPEHRPPNNNNNGAGRSTAYPR